MSSRHVLLQPRWVVAHVMILAIVVTFPLLGLWQLDRWGEQREVQARLEERSDAAPLPLEELLDEQATASRLAGLEYRPVRATGHYLADEEVAHRNRSFQGRGGFDWLTPLVVDEDTAILVRRGWVPPSRTAGVDPTPAPPAEGEVTVTGWLERSGEQPNGIGARDPATGVLETVFHADVERIDQQTTPDLLPMVLHLSSQQPAPTDGSPVPQPLPTGDDGSQNLSYAVQWFSFTAIAVIGYAVVLRRRLREETNTPTAEDAHTHAPPSGPQ